LIQFLLEFDSRRKSTPLIDHQAETYATEKFIRKVTDDVSPHADKGASHSISNQILGRRRCRIRKITICSKFCVNCIKPDFPSGLVLMFIFSVGKKFNLLWMKQRLRAYTFYTLRCFAVKLNVDTIIFSIAYATELCRENIFADFVK